MKPLVYLVCFASAAALALAQQNTNANASTSPIAPADEAAIRALSKAFEQACNEKAWSKAVAIFADDSIWMPPHAPSIAGRPAVEAFLRGFPPFKDLWAEPLEIHGRGDLAYVRGRYACVWLPPGQPEHRDTGKYAEIWRKQADGKWSYLRGIFNSDLPPVAADGTAAAPASGARPPAVEAPSVTKALPAGDIAAIRAGVNALMKAINDKAWPAAAELFAEKGIIHPPNGRAVVGRAEIETWMRAYPPTRDLRLELLEIEGRGDFAYVRGRYSIVVLPPNQPEQADSGKFIELWRKQSNGAWKLDRDIFNSDHPVLASPGQGTAASSTEAVVAAVKAAVEKHWAAINGNDGPTIDRQHTEGLSMFLADVEPRMRLNSPIWLGVVQRWQGAKVNWKPREIEVQPLSATVAVASFSMDGSVRWSDGSVDARPRRVTEIWVNENGTWKEAHHHDSVFAANPKPALSQ